MTAAIRTARRPVAPVWTNENGREPSAVSDARRATQQ